MFLTSKCCFRLKYEFSIHNIAFFSELVQNRWIYTAQAMFIGTNSVKTVLNSSMLYTFLLEEELLWILDSYFGEKWWFKVKRHFMNYKNFFFFFTSQDFNWWTGVMWIIGCFYQLFELSFWRHPFTAVDPLISKWCNAKFLQTFFDIEI